MLDEFGLTDTDVSLVGDCGEGRLGSNVAFCRKVVLMGKVDEIKRCKMRCEVCEKEGTEADCACDVRRSQ